MKLAGMGMVVMALGRDLGMLIGPVAFGQSVEGLGWLTSCSLLLPFFLVAFIMENIIGIIGIAFVGIVTVFFVHLKRKQDEIEANFQKRFAGKKIRFMDKHALYVARESDGYSHFRGQGYLVLTEDELYFERQLVKRIIKISTGAIVRVEKAKRLAGQGPGMMLKVVFKKQDGEQDAIGWKVKELDQWIKAISLTARNSA